MRILVANHHLASARGSETFTYTLTRELARQGHDVHVFAFTLGPLAARMSRFARIIDRHQFETGSHDLALISHNSCLQAYRNEAPVILTCHGTVPELEQPVAGADAYVAISEEVADHMRGRGFEPGLIRNGVDCQAFSPTRPLSPRLERVLLLSNYDAAGPIVEAACREVGVGFSRVGGARSVEDPAAAINEADLVVSLGRGAYESLACGRNVIVFDRRDYDSVQGADGFATPDTLPEFLRCNCSGRARGSRWGIPELVAALRQYDPALGEANRAFVLEHLDVRRQALAYLEVPCGSPA